ncbi:MAG: PTS sugar transporter subunit IIA [Limisphaerales bacterium]
MKSLLNALQEGRFVELPETDKNKALHYVATLIEAIPDLNPGTDVAEAVLSRESQFNTGMGLGWACPHMRTTQDGELICAAGWSPAGINYGAPDQKAVHFVVMYCVPDSQKHVYLKEISSLVKAIQKAQGRTDIPALQNLTEARDWILDLVSTALETQVSEVKARMIHLEAKQAAATSEVGAPAMFPLPDTIVPVSVLVIPGTRPIILSQDQEVVAKLEAAGEMEAALAKQAPFDHAGYRILFRGVTCYQPKRLVYDCLAIRFNGSVQTDRPKA